LATSELKSCLERHCNWVHLGVAEPAHELVEVLWGERENALLLQPRQLAPASRVLCRRRECDCGGDDGLHRVHHDGGDAINAGALTHLKNVGNFLVLRLHLTGEVTVVDSVRECDNRRLLIEL
jgi:hypothetical protein